MLCRNVKCDSTAAFLALISVGIVLANGERASLMWPRDKTGVNKVLGACNFVNHETLTVRRALWLGFFFWEWQHFFPPWFSSLAALSGCVKKRKLNFQVQGSLKNAISKFPGKSRKGTPLSGSLCLFCIVFTLTHLLVLYSSSPAFIVPSSPNALLDSV